MGGQCFGTDHHFLWNVYGYYSIMPVIEDVIAKIPDWKGKSIAIQPVAGGLTNANYKVSVEGKPFFVRVPGEKTELLAVDRRNEHYNSVAAAQTGIGPQVYYYIAEYQAMVLEYLEGMTMSNASLAAAGMPTRIAQAIKLLHAGPCFLTDFNMFRLTEFYLDICKQHAIHIPDGYPRRMRTIHDIEEAMAVHPVPSVPCNNDLLAENYIDDGQAIRIIDYEYSGNNDPCFELGNTCQELMYDEIRIIEVCQTYLGEAREDMISRMKLYMIMSDVGWALWAAIQASISKIDYDFWGWAIERWGRAVEKMDGREFPAWLENVRRFDHRKVA
jgi:thiamine kinase-like enzyme